MSDIGNNEENMEYPKEIKDDSSPKTEEERVKEQIAEIISLISQGKYEEAENLANSIYISPAIKASMAIDFNAKIANYKQEAIIDELIKKAKDDKEDGINTDILAKNIKMLEKADTPTCIGAIFNKAASDILNSDSYQKQPEKIKALTSEIILEEAKSSTINQVKSIINEIKKEVILNSIAVKFEKGSNEIEENKPKIKNIIGNIQRAVDEIKAGNSVRVTSSLNKTALPENLNSLINSKQLAEISGGKFAGGLRKISAVMQGLSNLIFPEEWIKQDIQRSQKSPKKNVTKSEEMDNNNLKVNLQHKQLMQEIAEVFKQHGVKKSGNQDNTSQEMEAKKIAKQQGVLDQKDTPFGSMNMDTTKK